MKRAPDFIAALGEISGRVHERDAKKRATRQEVPSLGLDVFGMCPAAVEAVVSKA
jgi:hypothetical protein